MGATDQSERLGWVKALWSRLSDPMKDRLIRNLRRLIHKDFFAGAGSSSQIFWQLTTFVNKVTSGGMPPVRTSNASELCEVRRSLIGRRLHGKPDHIQGDIMERLPLTVRMEIASMKAEPHSSVLARKQCNRIIAAHIDKLYNDDPTRCTFARCYVHEGLACPVGQECIVGPYRSAAKDDGEEPMTAATGGCRCVDNSAMNLHSQGDGGRTFACSSLFITERAWLQEDWSYIECTPGWNCGIVRGKMPKHFEVCRLILRGEDVGDAYDRERMGCMTYNAEKYALAVPLDSYLSFAGATTAFDLEEFWSSTAEEQDDEIREFLERRVHPVGVGEHGLQWDDVMLPSQKKRRLDYDMEYERKVRLGLCFPGELAIYDLDQQLGSHGRVLVDSIAGRPVKLPTLITHGCWWNRNKQTVLTAVDQLKVHGWPVTPTEIEEHGTIIDWKSELRNNMLLHKDVVKMMGDSWHIPVQGKFLMYWLSILEDKRYSAPTLSVPCSVLEEEDQEEACSQGSVMTISVSSDCESLFA